VTLPAQLDAAAADQVTAAFTPGVSVIIADLTARRVLRALSHPEPAQGPPQGHRPG